MRLAVVAVVAACSFDHGLVPGGDGGAGDGVTNDAGDAPRPPAGTRKLLFDNSASTVDFGPHPVLLALDATKLDYAAVADPTTHLRFEYATQGITASVGDNVPFEIERWNPSGESIVWIRVPEILKGTTGTAVLMYVGPSAGGLASASATWQSWELVQHMATGLTSSAGAYTPSAINMSFAPGQFGEAVRFSGSGDARITFANGGALFDGWNEYYVQFWIYPDYDSAADLGAQQPGVMDKGTSINLGRLYANGGNIVFQLDQHFTGNGNSTYLNTTLPPKAWTMISIMFDGDVVTIAKNGVAGTTVDLSGGAQALVTSTQSFYLGHSSNPFKGMIDELRIERRSRSVDFMRAQYLSGTRQFVTFSDP